MSGISTSITLDDERRVYMPGELLSGGFRITAIDPREVRAVELSVLWYTEGKGEEDLDVHYFERHSLSGAEPFDLRQTHRFNTELPNSPLSYSGVILKIRWCVRLRVYLARGNELTAEKRFQLGAVPEAHLPEGVVAVATKEDRVRLRSRRDDEEDE